MQEILILIFTSINIFFCGFIIGAYCIKNKIKKNNDEYDDKL